MPRYLFIESRDPFDSSDCRHFAEIVQGVADRGNETVLFLIQNGVLPARKGSKHNDMITNLMKKKVRVLADQFSLGERSIDNPADGIEASGLDNLMDLLFEPETRAIWH